MGADHRELLRASGLRVTLPRLAVLDVLAAAPGPLTHADVVERTPSDLHRATVFRNLVDLADAGLVVRRDHGDHVWRYELAGADEHAHDGEHPHFVCTECGTMQCLPGEASAVAEAAGLPKGAKPTQIELRGTCDDCG